MALTVGTQLGSYEITAQLGKGGMGEVYRARDTRLDRDVAIKTLPEEFEQESDQLARFEPEAKLLASLNHPHIAAIYELEKFEGRHFLVLELVEGETLADQIARGPIPVDEALKTAQEIAEALEAAHEKSVVHRDLKPANIKIASAGRVKVLDFGLAKMLEADMAASSLSASPTLLSANPTNAGVILGTAAYMSPEQSRGKLVDRRTDIWAFGCVLFEMLTGKQAFEGETVTDLFASILRSQPDWNALPATTPQSIHRVLRQCLQKDVRRRLQHIGDARIVMEEAEDISIVPPTPASTSAGQRASSPTLWVASTVVLLILLLSGIAFFLFTLRSTESPRAVKFSVGPPEKGAFWIGLGNFEFTNANISPDGRRLAFTARDASGKVLVWIRPLDSLVAQPLTGTDDASYPFWSPDNHSIAFFSQGRLKRVDIAGGPAQTIAEAASPRGGTWNGDNVIVFAPASNAYLARVPAAGGEPVAVTKVGPGQGGHRSPSFLPDGRHFLYQVLGASELSGIYVGTLDSSESKRLVAADTGAVYSKSGELLFVRQGTLLRQRFDLDKLELSGDPVPVAEGISTSTNVGAFSVSDNGTLVYRTSAGDEDLNLPWLDRSGKVIENVGGPGAYRGVDVSPDGKRVAVHRHDTNGGDIWVFESSRGPMSRQTFEPTRDNSSPTWSPDGTQVAFGAVVNGKWAVFTKPVNGGAEEKLFEAATATAPMSWSPDGRFLVLRIVDPNSGADEWVLSIKDKKATPLLQDRGSNELRAQISPDGKLIAYESNETGRPEIYVKAFPSGDQKRQLTTNGGIAPRWRGDGKELFFITNGAKMSSVKISTSGSLTNYTLPEEMFDSGMAQLTERGGSSHYYAVSPDGNRFLIPRRPNIDSKDTGAVPITVIVNWYEELKQLVPVK